MVGDMIQKDNDILWGDIPRWYHWYRFALLPSVKIRRPDKWNTWSMHFSWLCFDFWTMDSISFGVEFNIQEDIMFRFQIPFAILAIHIPILPQFFLQKFWRKSKGVKDIG